MVGTFSQRVIELALSIPEGRVTTYGILARAAGGGAQSARSVTGILSKYPNAKAIPFHRIVYAGGKIWCSPEYNQKRASLYKREHIKINHKGYVVDFDEIVFHFNK